MNIRYEWMNGWMDEEKRRKEEIRWECWNSFYIHSAIPKAAGIIIVFIVFVIRVWFWENFMGIIKDFLCWTRLPS